VQYLTSQQVKVKHVTGDVYESSVTSWSKLSFSAANNKIHNWCIMNPYNSRIPRIAFPPFPAGKRP